MHVYTISLLWGSSSKSISILFPGGWHSQSNINHFTSFCVLGTLNSCGRSKESSASVASCVPGKPSQDCVPGSELEWHLHCLLIHFRSLTTPPIIQSMYSFLCSMCQYCSALALGYLRQKTGPRENWLLIQCSVPLLKQVQFLACRFDELSAFVGFPLLTYFFVISFCQLLSPFIPFLATSYTFSLIGFSLMVPSSCIGIWTQV